MSTVKTYYGYDKGHKYKNNQNRFNKEDRNKVFSIPSAAELAEYEELSEGAADRIIEMFEAEQIHRHEYENKSLKANSSNKNLATICNAIIAICIILASICFSFVSDDNFTAIMTLISGFTFLGINNILRYFKRERKFGKNRYFKNNYKTPRNNEELK